MDLRDGPETVLREVVSERMRGLCCTSEVAGLRVERSRRESKNHAAQRTRVTTSTLLRFAETQQNQSVAKLYSLASSLMITIPTSIFSLYFFSFRAVRRLFPLLSSRPRSSRRAAAHPPSRRQRRRRRMSRWRPNRSRPSSDFLPQTSWPSPTIWQPVRPTFLILTSLVNNDTPLLPFSSCAILLRWLWRDAPRRVFLTDSQAERTPGRQPGSPQFLR